MAPMAACECVWEVWGFFYRGGRIKSQTLTWGIKVVGCRQHIHFGLDKEKF